MCKRVRVCLSLFCLSAVMGCGGSDSLRHPLQGTVRVDGVAIENGSISFLPSRGTSGPPATTLIVQGEYEFTTENGPVSGRHRVVVGADPKQTFAGNGQTSPAQRNQPPRSDVQVRGIETSKLAPAPLAEPGPQGDPRQRRFAATKNRADDKPPPPDPSRNQWETQYVVPAELTLQKNFDFATPAKEPES